MRETMIRGLLVAALFVTSLRPSFAQEFEAVGTRAQGMAGAFVAVSDDSTATWWNPAGLATGAFFNLALERGVASLPADAAAAAAVRHRTSGFSMAFPALGLSYYRLRISEIGPRRATGAQPDGRQEEGAAGVGLRSVSASQYGVTVGQSVGNHLVIASTLKLVRAGAAAADVGQTEDASDGLDQAEDLDVAGGTEGDLDIGAMVAIGAIRMGLVVKHLREPTFEGGDGEFELSRQARAGIAVVGGNAGPIQGITAALDADVTRTTTPLGEVRHVAAGVEGWFLRRAIGVRGGVSTNTVGEKGTSYSAGGSVAARAGAYFDAAWTFGSDESTEGWNVGLRVTF